MRKKGRLVILTLLVSVLFVAFLAIPVETKAQSVDTQARIAELNNQLITLLKQIVALLTAQIQQLQQQIVARQGQPVTPPPTPPAQTVATPTVVVVENKPPKVNITYPYSGLEITTPASTDVVASAFDEDGTVSKVEFFEGKNSLGTYTGSRGPWSVRWNSIPAGTYSLTVKATDDKGGQTTSRPVELRVRSLGESSSGRTNIPPTITVDLNNTTTTSSTVITITATAADYDGNVTSVAFSRAASTTSVATISTDTTSPFTATTTLPAIGIHTVSALATDNEGLTTRSASSTITVVQ